MKKILLFLVLSLPIAVSSCKDKCPDDPCYFEYQPAPDAKNVSLNPIFYWCEDPNAVKYRLWVHEDANGVNPIDTIVEYNQFTPRIRYANSYFGVSGGTVFNHKSPCNWKVWSINASGDTTLLVNNRFTTKDVRPDIAGHFRAQRWAAGNNSGTFHFGGYHFDGYTDLDIKLLSGDKDIEVTDLGLGLIRPLRHDDCCLTYAFSYSLGPNFPFSGDGGSFKLNALDSFRVVFTMEDDPNSPDVYYYYGRQR